MFPFDSVAVIYKTDMGKGKKDKKDKKKDKRSEEERRRDAMSHKGRELNQWPPEAMAKLLEYYKWNQSRPVEEQESLNKICKRFGVPYNTAR